MKRLIYILLFFACAMPLGGQNRTQNGALTGQKKYPLLNYFELACPEPAVVSEWKDVKGVQISWGSVDSSYAKTSVPVSKVVKALRLDAWRGETVMAQALVWSAKSAPDVTFSLDLPFSAETGYVRYNPDPDVIDTFPRSLDLQPMTCQPVWLAISIPRDASPGTYRGKLTVRSGAEVAGVLSLAVKVDARILPDPSRWRDVPDMIPNPWSVARYYHLAEWKTEYTEAWSPEHFENMRPLMERLSSAGMRKIYVQESDLGLKTTDAYRPMTVRLERLDGTSAEYADVRDAWIAFMRSCGFDGPVVTLTEARDKLQYCSWPAEVILDGRASSAHPDDAFLVYPGNRPSVRWMLLLRDLQNNQKKFAGR